MFEWIKTFIAVYETKILVRRPNNCIFLSQLFLLQIKKLEQHFSIKLFYRNGKQSVIPTKEADFYIQKCSRLLKA